MWIFNKIVTHNFGILKGTQETELGDKEIIGIRAEYEDDKTRSNRGGKTTFIEAFQYALTGDCRAKKELHMIHRGEKVMWVEIHLLNVDTQDKRVIKRGRDHKNNGLLTLDWVDKVADAQEEINDFLGIDKDFELTNYFKQSQIHGFMEKDPAEKGTLLTKWITKGHWKEKEQKAIEDRDAIKIKLKDNDATLKALESVMEIVEPLEVELKTLVTQRQELGKKHSALVTSRAKDYQKYSELKKSKDKAQQIISDLEEEYADKLKPESEVVKKRRDSLEKAKSFLELNKQYDKQFDRAAVNKLEDKLDLIRAKDIELRSQLKKMTEIKTPICPILKESCDRIKFSEADVKKIEAELKELVASKEVINEKLNKQVEIENSHTEYRELKKSHDNLLTLVSESNVASRISENRKKLEEAQKNQTQDLGPLVQTVKATDAEIIIVATQLAEVDKKVGQLEHRIKTSNDALKKIDEVARRSAELRAELEDLNYIVFMFSRNGIPANEIENAFGDVQDNINYILDGMECGFNINFSPDRELDKWEPVCHCGFAFPKGYRKTECEDCGSLRQKQRKNEITIEVTENGETQDFNLDSGGGKTLVSYAVRIGITMLKRDQNKNKLSVLFLDEVDSALDPYFVDQITSSITKVLTKKLGFKQILMVSHKSKIRDAVPSILQVTRTTQGHSEVSWAQ